MLAIHRQVSAKHPRGGAGLEMFIDGTGEQSRSSAA